MLQRTDTQFNSIDVFASKRVIWMDEGFVRKHCLHWFPLILSQDLFPALAFRSVDVKCYRVTYHSHQMSVKR